MSGENVKTIVLKLALLGDAGVGKTSLINMYTEKHFREDYKPTLGVSITVKEIELENVNTQIRLVIWDIAGQDRYDSSRKMFFQGVFGALLVYDTTRHSTFQNIEAKWLKDLKEYGEIDSTYILIGNKIDLKDSRIISPEKGKELANKLEATDFIETSAKYGENVEEAFKRLVERVFKNQGIELDPNNS